MAGVGCDHALNSLLNQYLHGERLTTTKEPCSQPVLPRMIILRLIDKHKRNKSMLIVALPRLHYEIATMMPEQKRIKLHALKANTYHAWYVFGLSSIISAVKANSSL